ncbi:hypothetical protein QAD02_015105 [Eretmocerus hayati]|uniref:Uncharacterized protein n=1 Tax=Eretmocerus hayati TaxID=131215 RepID=A0ACC2P8A9_9HYME|nr:hypothetical protein QAD02_015105 [Eretmocerus hayati]
MAATEDDAEIAPFVQHQDSDGVTIQIAPKRYTGSCASDADYGFEDCEPTGFKRTSLFIIMSFIYAKLLVVICVAYVISEVVTHRLPLYYYEGFFTYLYGVSILFLLYVFCFLLQESACCSRGSDGPPAPKPEFQDASDVEAGVATRAVRRRKTSQNDSSHGSFFLRIGAIGFGLGTMVYNGLEFGTFFEVPPTSPCYQILQGVNPCLQMIFTFMQMYFIFMNSRLNIHRFKVIARFGLMHVVATNLCVWIRTLVLESIKEIAQYHRKLNRTEIGFLASIKDHSLKNAGTFLGERPRDIDNPRLGSTPYPMKFGRAVSSTASSLTHLARSTLRPVARAVTAGASTTAQSASSSSSSWPTSTSTWPASSTSAAAAMSTSTVAPSSESSITTTITSFLSSMMPTKTDILSSTGLDAIATSATTGFPAATYDAEEFFGDPDVQSEAKNNIARFGIANATANLTSAALTGMNSQLFSPDFNAFAEALTLTTMAPGLANNTCGRINIMGNIVKDAAPYLYPFIIEYSLIGAAVIYVMWKHIGRHPRWPHQAEADLERRLEAMLSRRAVALANAGQGRMDCVGASKGLFFGLLLLVGSLICLILFFVLIQHPKFGLLAIYLADVSHCVIMGLSIFAIIIGFCRVRHLKFKAEEQSDLNDILLRVSGFGLFIYATFSVIAGVLGNIYHEPNLLVLITNALAIGQVFLQLLFIADVSRRRVHLPEHDRSKPGRQIVTFLLICNVTMWVIYTFEAQKVAANPVQIQFYGYLPWALVQRFTIPLCIFHRFHSAVTLAEIWKTSYKARLE